MLLILALERTMSPVDRFRPEKSTAFRLLADLDLYEDAMRAVAEDWPRIVRMREAAELFDALHSVAQVLPAIAPVWASFQSSHARTLLALSSLSSIDQRLDALERHVAVLLDLQRACLDVVTGH